MAPTEILAETQTHFLVAVVDDEFDNAVVGYTIHSKPYGWEVGWAISYELALEVMFGKVF